MSGEAAARSNIDLPGEQQELIDAIKATGKPFVVVLFNGRPLTLANVDASSPAILEAWFPGIEAGNAVADVLFGKVNPGGKLPGLVPAEPRPDPDLLQPRADRTSVRRDVEVQLALPRPRLVRPAVRVRLRAELHDVLGHEPPPRARRACPRNGKVTATVDVTNTGGRAGDDVVQLYIHDPGREHLAAGAPPARVPARDAGTRRDADRHASPSTRATSASTTTAASSWSSRARSTSTPVTARRRPSTQSFTVTG